MGCIHATSISNNTIVFVRKDDIMAQWFGVLQCASDLHRVGYLDAIPTAEASLSIACLQMVSRSSQIWVLRHFLFGDVCASPVTEYVPLCNIAEFANKLRTSTICCALQNQPNNLKTTQFSEKVYFRTILQLYFKLFSQFIFRVVQFSSLV